MMVGKCHFISTAPQIAYAYIADYLRLRPDVAVEVRSLKELARLPELASGAIGGDGGRLEPRSGPKPSGRIGRRPLGAARPGESLIHDDRGRGGDRRRVPRSRCRGRPIPQLYAVGQNGLGGQILWGHGLHIAWAITSGRLVGRQLGRRPSRTETEN